MDVFGAFTLEGQEECPDPVFTGFNTSGLTLDALNLNPPVVNPENAIDGNPNTFSSLSFGVLGVAGVIEQFVVLGAPSRSDATFNVRLRLTQSLLTAGVLNNVNIVTTRNGQVVTNQPLNSLLNVDLLGLLQPGQFFDFPVTPGQPVDRVSVRYSSLLNLTVAQSLDFAGVFPGIVPPVVDADAANVEICEGEPAILTATAPQGTVLRWYNVAEGGTPLAETAFNEPFTTPILTENTTFFVAAFDPICNVESLRVPIEVTVNPAPRADDIVVVGNEMEICPTDALVLTPSLSPSSMIDPAVATFRWYLDENKNQEVRDGDVINGASFSIDPNGVLTVINLGLNSGIPALFVSVTNEFMCENPAGDLFQVPILFRDDCDDSMLMILKESAPTVIAGENLTYTLTVRNTGLAPSLNTVVRDVLPAGLIFQEASDGGVLQNGEVIWNLGELAPAAERVLTLSVRVPANVPMGTVLTNIANVDSDNEPNGPVNSDPNEVTVETGANLAIMKQSTTARAVAGENLAYTITVTNNGPSDAQDVVVTDPIPVGTSFVSADMGGMLENGIVTWNIGVIPAGETVTLSLVVLVDAN
ncbi:MAG: Ig-like domain-containing protein, partial [Nitritalea sp.]